MAAHYRRYARARAFPSRYRSKYEVQFAEQLELRQRAGEITWWDYEPLTFRLGERCSYTPDFVAIGRDGHITVFEVKGWARDDAMAKLKTAASRYWWLQFVLVTRDGKRGFVETPVKT